MAIAVEETRPLKRARLTFHDSAAWKTGDNDAACDSEKESITFLFSTVSREQAPNIHGVCRKKDQPFNHRSTAHNLSIRLLDAENTKPIPGSCSSHVTGPSRDVHPPCLEDDKNGHFNFEPGESLASRYKIHKKLGEGTFGRVLECWDRDTHKSVAIKVIRSVQKYRDAAMIEIDVLRVLAKHDRSRACGCIRMKDWFDYRNHICIVFELLGPSLYDFLRKNNYEPFPIDFVREFGQQLLESISYMHDLSLIHTDLKPENVLLASSDYIRVRDFKVSSKQFKCLPKSSEIKLIDFGSATFESDYHSSIVSTRHYRAPEVILGLRWSYPCDLWSIGCILVELCSGEMLFQTHENMEHLAMMERVLGPIPKHMIKRADSRAGKYFRDGRELYWPEGAKSRESIRAVQKLPRLNNLVMDHVDHSAGAFIDLLRGLLKYDPADRLTAKEALRHPFFADGRRAFER